jgi:hypothetical protein
VRLRPRACLVLGHSRGFDRGRRERPLAPAAPRGTCTPPPVAVAPAPPSCSLCMTHCNPLPAASTVPLYQGSRACTMRPRLACETLAWPHPPPLAPSMSARTQTNHPPRSHMTLQQEQV